jgi:hypothetical protein
MYISLADSRIRGFVKWADTHEPKESHNACPAANGHSSVAAMELADEAMSLSEQLHCPWLVPGAGRP